MGAGVVFRHGLSRSPLQFFTAPAGAFWRENGNAGITLYISLLGSLHFQSDFGEFDVPASYAACIPPGVEYSYATGEGGGYIASLELVPIDNDRITGIARTPCRLEDSHSYYLISKLISSSLDNMGDAQVVMAALLENLVGDKWLPNIGWYESVINAISRSLPVPPSLEHLSDLAGMHPMTLTKKFRRLHGCSIGEFRQRMRAERAFYRIIKQPAPLSDISIICGYSDQSHMTRDLRRFFSVTPAYLRQVIVP